jgi:hypothetical protein
LTGVTGTTRLWIAFIEVSVAIVISAIAEFDGDFTNIPTAFRPEAVIGTHTLSGCLACTHTNGTVRFKVKAFIDGAVTVIV